MAQSKSIIRWAVGGAAVVVVVALLWSYARPRVRDEWVRARIAAMLDSADSAERSLAAWRFIENPLPDIETRMTGGLMGDEREANVRESFAWALGKIGEKRNLGVLRHVIDLDASGEVRLAAWLATANLDRDVFLQAVAEKSPLTGWDEFAAARARLHTGDLSEVRTVLRFAREGDESQQKIASFSLIVHLRKYLDSVGAWPIDVTSTAGERLTAANVDAIAARCERLKLAAIAGEVARHADAGERIKHTIRRLTSGRERIAKVLGVATTDVAPPREDSPR